MTVNSTRQAGITGRGTITMVALIVLMGAAGRTLAQPSHYKLDSVPDEEVLRVILSIRGGTIIVDWHGTWDYETIQEALYAAEDGDTIIVLPSTGSPDDAYVENVYFPAKTVTLRSLNPDEPEIVAQTIIDGNASGTVLRFADEATRDSVLDGFTITNGMDSSPLAAGGVHCEGSPTISRCVVTGNTAAPPEPRFSGGGGILCLGGSPLIVGCTIESNVSSTGGGGLLVGWGDPEVVDCVFRNNETPHRWGGGALIDGAHATFQGCVFASNSAGYGGGVAVDRMGHPASADFVSCSFVENLSSSGGGGLYSHYAPITLQNCILNGNRAAQGAGICTYNTSIPGVEPLLVNCTITSNAAAENGGGLYLAASTPELTNCILWGNTAVLDGDQIYQSYGEPPVVTYSCVQGGWPGEGDIDTAPDFVDVRGLDLTPGTEDDNLRLLPTSLCLDAGIDEALLADFTDLDGDGDTDEPTPFDLDGNSRVLDENVDMGAYEGPKLAFVIVGDPVSVGEGAIPGRAVPERGIGAFLVRLSMDPGGCVEAHVHHHVGDPDISVYLGGTLYFDSTNYSTYQPVVLSAAEDDDWTTGQATVAVTAPNVFPGSVLAVEEENDPVPPVVFVDASADGLSNGTTWADAFTEVPGALSAIDNSPGTEEIWVAAGVYTPAEASGDRAATFQLSSGLAWYGGFPAGGGAWEDRDPALHETILSGDLAGNDGPDFADNDENSYHVVTAGGVDSTAVLDGFTISGGHANGGQGHREGAGLYNDGGSPTVANCMFQRNKVFFESGAAWGAAMYNGGNGSPTVIGCRFADNLIETFFVSEGGAIANVGTGNPSIVSCTFVSNRIAYFGYGGAISNSTSGSPTITNCLFVHNSAGTGYGGAVYSSAGSPTYANCTVIGNSASIGGGLYSTGDGVTVSNGIFWGNTASEASQIAGDDTYVEHSDIQGGWTGPGHDNIDANPLFVDPDGGDYRLSWESPCIDAANNNSVPADWPDLDGDGDTAEPIPFDLRGNPRFVDCPWVPDTGHGLAPIVDMGTYERRGRRLIGVLDAVELNRESIEVERGRR